MNLTKKLVASSLITLASVGVLGDNVPLPIKVQDSIFYASSEVYKKHKNNSHFGDFEDMSNFIDYRDPTIKSISDYFVKESLSKEETLEKMWEFVRSHVKYYADSLITSFTGNYIRSPLETLIEGKGDCEDIAILFASLVKAQGWGVCLFHLKNKDKEVSHVAAGVAGDFEGWHFKINGKKYFIADSAYDKEEDFDANFHRYGEMKGSIGRIDREYMYTNPVNAKAIK